ncbi:hypothetical protein ACJO14_15325 [Vibrio parahaemolyticus]|uniref:hypothetical protein n=1 Tax=Vibrio parahaemolyticus TaxID=670 RepID=UPI00387AEF3F
MLQLQCLRHNALSSVVCVAHHLMRRYTLYEESLKIQVNNLSFQRCALVLGVKICPFLFSFSSVRGSHSGRRLGMVLFFAADSARSVDAKSVAETQLYGFTFLKADLFAEMALSLVW